MLSLNEWMRDKNTKTLTITCRDNENTLEKLLKHMKEVGNSGHTFVILVDPEYKGPGLYQGGERFEWDGDGSDAIFEIKSEIGK